MANHGPSRRRVTLDAEQVEGAEPERVDVFGIALQDPLRRLQRRVPVPGAHSHLGLLRDGGYEGGVDDGDAVEGVQRAGHLT